VREIKKENTILGSLLVSCWCRLREGAGQRKCVRKCAWEREKACVCERE